MVGPGREQWPVRGAGPGWRRAPADARPLLTVVDATGLGTAAALRPALAGLARVRDADGFRPGGHALLLVPLSRATGDRARGNPLAVDLELARTAGAGNGAVVVAWFVDDDVRDEVAVPAGASGRPGGSGNGAAALAGTAWRTELARHRDPLAAARCHGRRIRILLDAPGVQSVADPPPAAVHAAVGDLDPGLVVTACPLVRHGDRTTWAGLPAVAAAVDLRLRALRRHGPAG
ncbi:hypothetical protein WHI96_11490 [Pseudonocardia tropica]|uniref:Uncharacterized protein n=1 Tax=Pseudonocardia tropica TaxID=681289 RepID=A0ABV1JU33_9PSEU